MKLELVARKGVSHVELGKDEKYCLGITIADGTKDEAGPVVKKVKLKGPAGKSYAIDRGDIILSLNGHSMVGTKSKDIIRMIKEAGNVVDFKVQYKTQEIRITHSCAFRKQQQKIELHKMNDFFGFILRKNDAMNSYAQEFPIISNIKEGSAIHRDGRIHDGDRLLKVDGVSLSWLSLSDISRMLQDKSKAEFTFEYNVAMVDFAKTGRKIDLDIDVPTADLGICFTADTEESGLIFIQSIRLGSIAERCGLFCEGDVILSINEIDTKFLTASKANVLLKISKKCRKISFISSKGKRVKSLRMKVSSERGCSKEKDTATTSSSGEQVCHDSKHVNTPASSNMAFPIRQGDKAQKLNFSEQIRFINKLQSIVRAMRNLKEILLQLNTVASERTQPLVSENCTSCNECQHSVQLCASCVEKLNTKCTESIDVLQSIATHFVTYSPSSMQNLHSAGEAEANTTENVIDENTLRVPTGEVVYHLTETLPKVLVGDSQLTEQLQALAKVIISAEPSCSICDYEVKSVWIIVQKILLLLSLEYNGPEIKRLIKQLLCCLFNVKFSCESLSNCEHLHVDDCHCFLTEKLSASSSVSSVYDASLSESDTNTTRANIKSESLKTRDSMQRSMKIPQINMKRDYLKIIRIESPSPLEEFCDRNNPSEGDAGNKSLVENYNFSLLVNNLESSSTSLKLEDTDNNRDEKIYKNKGLSLTPAKTWRSLESILRPSKAIKELPEISNKFLQNKCTAKNSNETAQEAPSASSHPSGNHLAANHIPSTNGANSSGTNGGSTSSSYSNRSQKGSHTCTKKVRTDTVVVKLTNNGDGFGVGLSERFISAKKSSVSVINTIKQKGPAQRSGILKIDDRIIAINHRSTLGLTSKELQTLKRTSFSARTVSLTIEFDIVEAEPKIGTFDVVLDKTLKIGLIFEDMQRGYPMVVSGIVKGSGAHRCGQLFPGDKIKFFRCIRNEEFDPVSCNYTREESVLITVQRDRTKGFREKSAPPSPCYLNPCFSHKDSVPRRGLTFVVKSSAIHVVEGTDALVLDQEVTLFRDPVSWDFGFLVGENPETGRAYVTDVRPNGPACESGVIKKFDRIMEVNGVSVDKNVENSVLSLLSQASHKVDLLIRRLYHEDSNTV